MARPLKTREYVLVVALAGVLGLAWYTLGGRGPSARDEAPDDAAGGLGQAPVVRLDDLSGQIVDYDPQDRNLFAYYTPPRPVAKPPVVRAPERVVRPAPPPPAKPPQRADPKPVVARPPKVPFTFIGLLGPKDAKIAVFMEGEEMTLARAGEVLHGQFKLLDFQYQKVIIGYTDERFKDQTTELQQRKALR